MSRIKQYFKRIAEAANRNNKSSFLMFIDIILWYVFYGCTLTDYLNYEFYKRSFKERKMYAVVRTQGKFYERINPSQYKEFFTVKPNFMKNFKEYVGRDYFIPENGIDKLKLFLKNNKEFMIKPIDGLGGADVKKMSSKEVKNLDEFLKYLEDNRMFIEELIVQHKKMNIICPTSVNTIRIMTFANNNRSEILYAALRVGNGKYEVDNFHKGGMGVSIDIRTGKLKGEAIDKDLKHYKKHPTTKTIFNNYELPFWNETKELVLKAALVNQNIKVIGWDVAITKNGPILVEGNRRAGFDLVQVLSDRGRKDIMYYVDNKLKKR
ncbi:MAG: hypothetical protein II119_04480 [Bacilli bacterium]|nr:hypothetical protein [Bacilli bacterium]